ncbi:MAG TPA: hypothetical protein VLB73_05145 [Patescibacteria group bacterium]|jgi:hypothetical protein|nr:hypothetical protein [Patescibacteria group bacterium]
MKKFFKTIQKDSTLSWTFWTTIALILIMVGLIGIIYTNLPPFLPLYNQMPWGYDRLGKTYELFLLPLGVFFVCLLNTFIGVKLVEKIPLLARFLFLTTIALAVFTSIFLVRLILLVL